MSFLHPVVVFDPDDATPTYVGIAAHGSATSDPVWSIWKFLYSGTNVTKMQRASSAADQIWDNRGGLVYTP